MLIEQFNKLLVSFNQELRNTEIERRKLVGCEQFVFESIMRVDSEQKGYLTHQEIVGEWLKGSQKR